MPQNEPTPENLWNCFLATVREHPDRIAFQRAEQATSFTALLERGNQYAAQYRSLGVHETDRVMVFLESTAEMAAAVLGVWAVSGIPILVDPATSGSHIDHVIERATPCLIVAPSRLRIRALDERHSTLPRIGAEEVVGSASCLDSTSESIPTDPASILFTSGSTGSPKGVTQTHGSLIRANRAVAEALGLRDEDRIVCPIPWSFDYGYGQLLTTILRGTTQILPVAADPASLSLAIETHRPTVLPGVPSLFAYLLRGPFPFAETDLTSIRIVTNTGGGIPDAILSEMIELFAEASILLNYGLTESYRTTCLPADELKRRRTSIGKPIEGVEVLILREDGSLADPGEQGEIIHRGDYLFAEYWNDPESSARTLRPDPTRDPGEEAPVMVLFTGDLGSMDEEGFIYFHGRRDRQIKSMGVRVSPTEIEALLYGTGLLREVAVFARPNLLIGQEVWAAVVPIDSEPKIERRLHAYSHQAMSRYMKPRRYLVKDELPKTVTGKIDYLALELEADEAPSASLG